MYVIMQSVPFSQRLFHKNICLAGWLTLPTFYRRIGKVFTVHEYKDVFLFDISLLLGGGGGKIGSGDTRIRLVRFVALLASISSSVWRVYAQSGKGSSWRRSRFLGEISARSCKFSSIEESLRELVTIRLWYGASVLPRFPSEMEEDILSMRSRVFSHSRTQYSSPITDFHVYLFDIVLPVQFQSINKVLVPIFFSRNFRTDPHECTVSLGWNKMETCKRFNVSFFRNIVYLS